MNINIPNILAKGEGVEVEFKKAKNRLPSTLFETICAFLNRNGGVILLRVTDDKHPLKCIDAKEEYLIEVPMVISN